MSGVHDAPGTGNGDLRVADFEIIAFSLVGRDFGFDVMDVREVSRDVPVTRIPNCAPFVLGLAVAHGEIVPVIDLREVFDTTETNAEGETVESDTGRGRICDVIFLRSSGADREYAGSTATTGDSRGTDGRRDSPGAREPHAIGVAVDRINDVVGINSRRINPPHPIFGEYAARFIRGVIETGEKFVIILDAGMLIGGGLRRTES